MKRFNWEFDFDPYFPVHFFEYTVCGNSDPMHWHQYFEIGLCTQGKGSFLYMNKQYTVNTGDVFINNNYENHVAVTSEGNTNSYIFLILMPSFISDPINHRANKQYINTFYYDPPDFINKIPNDTEIANRLKQLIEQGYNVYSHRGNMWEIEVDIVVRKILFELAAHYYQNGSKESARENINPKISLALKYIKQNYNRTLSLNSIAAYVDLNPTYFRHLFKKEIRISFKDYVTRQRLSNARTLLINTDMSVNQIINEVGYSNTTQFYRVFRQHYHMTPAEYRKLQQGVT